MTWRTEFLPAAEREFGKLDSATQRSIVHYLDKLLSVKDPRTRGKALRGGKSGLWRYRVGKYRLICKIEEGRFVILVIRVAKRDTVYD